jgi:hypothetical protein
VEWDYDLSNHYSLSNFAIKHIDFSCAVESIVLLHGRMYITNKFLCFYSNLFGLEKKIRIPYSHIKNITKENTAMVIPNAIAITTGKALAHLPKNDSEYGRYCFIR